MIAATGRDTDGRPVVVIGLHDGDMNRLREKDTISLQLADYGLEPTTVMVLWGREPWVVRRWLESGFGKTSEQEAPRPVLAEELTLWPDATLAEMRVKESRRAAERRAFVKRAREGGKGVG